ncbi:MAG: flavin reductase family protein [Gordonia sp. (in: high G+C Gram-positive bacteria)]
MTTTTAAPHSGFRDAMAQLCTPVSVITAMDADRPHGTTVSAVMSLSLDPQLIAVSLAETSECLALIRRTQIFGVNILGAEQDNVALRFAAKGRSKFDEVAWRLRAGVPFIEGSAVWIGCEVAEVVRGGDHQILLGSVRDVAVAANSAPLTYHNRQFGTHVAQHN